MLGRAMVPALLVASGAGFFALGVVYGPATRTIVPQPQDQARIEAATSPARSRPGSAATDAAATVPPPGEAQGEGAEAEHADTEPGQDRTTGSPLPEGDGQPWRVIRHLQLLQDAIVQGEPDAIDNYRKALIIAGNHLAGLGPPVWDHQRNVAAVAVYLLIGGDPLVGDAAMARSALDEGDLLALRIARAYARKELARAHRLFGELDFGTLPHSARGQFALARSMVFASVDPASAGHWLDRARRLAPGTLIEEAALRRLVRIAGEAGDVDRFDFLARSYLDRFRASGYFPDFVRNFAVAMMLLPAENQGRLAVMFEALCDAMEPQRQLPILTYIAKRGTVDGKVKLSAFAARRAMEIVGEESKFHAQFALYLGAAEVVETEKNAQAVALLESIDAEDLDPPHRSLLQAVLELSRRITGEPVSLARVRNLLAAEQQVYPGDEPILPVTAEELRDELDGHRTVVRMKSLEAKMRRMGLEF